MDYNAQGRLATVLVDADGDGNWNDIFRYEYNDAGIRIKVVQIDPSDGITVLENTVYLVDPQNPTGYAQTLEEHVDGTLDKTYTLGLDVITQATAAEILHLLYDAHGSTRVLVDGAGNVALDGSSTPQVFTFDAYGHLVGFTSTPLTNHLRAGEYRDSNTGWDYNRARWSRDGRFNRLDPFAGDTQDPISLHKYLYANADPVMFVDPSGLTGTLSGQLSVLGNIGSFLSNITFPTVTTLAKASVGVATIATVYQLGVILQTDADVLTAYPTTDR